MTVPERPYFLHDNPPSLALCGIGIWEDGARRVVRAFPSRSGLRWNDSDYGAGWDFFSRRKRSLSVEKMTLVPGPRILR